MPKQNPNTDRGAAAIFYNSVTLKLYDKGVLRLTNNRIWKCPTPILAANYEQHAGKRHLDIGPGTGYYLQNLDSEFITLLDLNESSLRVAKNRIGDSASVSTITQSFFDDLDGHWESIAVNFLLHCIPGESKWDRLASLAQHLTPGGRVFGATVVLNKDASITARCLAGFYNRIGVFGNAHDTEDHLRTALSAYENSLIERHGQVLTFSATKAAPPAAQPQ